MNVKLCCIMILISLALFACETEENKELTREEKAVLGLDCIVQIMETMENNPQNQTYLDQLNESIDRCTQVVGFQNRDDWTKTLIAQKMDNETLKKFTYYTFTLMKAVEIKNQLKEE